MIRLHVLGALTLTGREGQALHSVLTQPKRQALLLWLVLRRPRGAQARAALLPLLWPDLDEARARAALSRAVHYLRSSLGDEAIRSVGQESIEVDDSRIWCDATEFEKALDASEPERALHLYRGDLLPGFTVDEAPQFDEWLEEERSRLRLRAGGAARALAHAATASGRHDVASTWLRRAIELSPWDETPARELMHSLHASGDRAGALAAYDDLVRRLGDLELAPDEDTQALAASLRSPVLTESDDAASRRSASSRPDERAVVATPAPVFDESRTAEPDSAPAAATTERSGVAVRTRASRKRHLIAATLLLVVALGGIGAWYAGKPRAMRVAASDGTVAVLPFLADDPELAWLETGLIDLLTAALRDGPLQLVDVRSVHRALGSASPAQVAADTGRAIAQTLNARYVVIGRIAVIDPQTIRLTAALHDTRVFTLAPSARAETEGPPDALPALVAELARQLKALNPASAAPVFAPPSFTESRSPAALRAYLEGEQLARRGRYTDAVLAFQRAVEADSTFALAFYRLSVNASWANGGDELVRWANAQAVRHSNSLAQLDQLRVQAWDLYLFGEPAQAEQKYRIILINDPADISAAFYLGETLYHWGPSIGKPATDARPFFERVLELEAEEAGALIHLARIAAIESRREDAARLTARVLALGPDSTRTREVRALQAYVLGDAAARADVRSYPGAADYLWPLVAGITTAAGPDALLEVADLLAANASDQTLRSRGEIVRVIAHVLRDDSVAVAASLRRLNSARATEMRALLHVIRSNTVDVDARTVRAELERFPEAPPVGAGDRFLATQHVYGPRRLLLLGLLSVRLGDLAAAQRYVAELERFAGFTSFDTQYAAAFGRILRAEILRAGNRPADALQALGEPAVAPDRVLPDISSYPFAWHRWLRAELLREAGRHAEAANMLATFPDPGGSDLVLLRLVRSGR